MLSGESEEGWQPPTVLEEEYRKIAGAVSRENRGGYS
jgi:hypothetical protein